MYVDNYQGSNSLDVFRQECILLILILNIAFEWVIRTPQIGLQLMIYMEFVIQRDYYLHPLNYVPSELQRLRGRITVCDPPLSYRLKCLCSALLPEVLLFQRVPLLLIPTHVLIEWKTVFTSVRRLWKKALDD